MQSNLHLMVSRTHVRTRIWEQNKYCRSNLYVELILCVCPVNESDSQYLMIIIY